MDLPLRLFSGVRGKKGPLVIGHMLVTGIVLKKLGKTQKEPKFKANRIVDMTGNSFELLLAALKDNSSSALYLHLEILALEEEEEEE